jgi:hypothetical protein
MVSLPRYAANIELFLEKTKLFHSKNWHCFPITKVEVLTGMRMVLFGTSLQGTKTEQSEYLSLKQFANISS